MPQLTLTLTTTLTTTLTLTLTTTLASPTTQNTRCATVHLAVSAAAGHGIVALPYNT